MTKSTALRLAWTTLKEQILTHHQHSTLLQENKVLLIDALEFLRQQASSWTSANSYEPLREQKELAREKERLLAGPDAESESTRKRLAKIEEILSNNLAIQAAFNNQKAHNEQIIQECQELLSKLENI